MRHCKTPRSTIVFRIIKISIVLFFVSSPFTFLGSVWLSDHLAQRSPPHNPRNPSEFFLIYQRIGQERISEIFVIVNAPVGAEAIMELVADFNRQSITVDTIQTHTVSRSFFRETRYLTRDFQIGEPYPPERMPFFWPGPDRSTIMSAQDIRNHPYARLIGTSYFRSGNGRSTRLRYRIPVGTMTGYQRRIPNIHAYFADSCGNVPENIPHIEFEPWEW